MATFSRGHLRAGFVAGGDLPDNCTDEFGRFPVAMAETRAKGRAFRAALRLRRVVAAEAAAGIPLDGERLDEQAIQVGQVNIISVLAERQDVSIPALLKPFGDREGRPQEADTGRGCAYRLFRTPCHISTYDLTPPATWLCSASRSQGIRRL